MVSILLEVKRFQGGFFVCLFVCLFVCCFLELHLQHMEVPRLGVKSSATAVAYPTATATRDLSHICNLYHSSQQCQILNPLRGAMDQNYLLMDIRFISAEPQWELQHCCI